MMDTDKKRKTIRCQKCGLTFSGERVYCPLCKKRIIDEGTEDSSIKEDFDVFPVTQKKTGRFHFYENRNVCGTRSSYCGRYGRQNDGIIRPHMAADIFSRRNRCGRRLCTFDCRTAKVEKYSQNGHV